ncbi:hypothetical protein DWQ67_02870 [Galactobacter caseinivorans]|uniref:Uncharacterized protein n=1 Tax=Galactobacter caseinivorans TaxID=2676123 RepID=A0A496PMM6_9MICC|nr:hypothetical protein DWQ67_02870 [Galactobacter caseinivorans]
MTTPSSDLSKQLRALTAESQTDGFLPPGLARPPRNPLPSDITPEQAYLLGQTVGAQYGVGFMAGAVDTALNRPMTS